MKSVINSVADCGGMSETSEEFIIQEKHTYMHGCGTVGSINIEHVREIWA